MRFTALSALVAFVFALGTEAAAFPSSEGVASTVTFAAPSSVATASGHHGGHSASSSFVFPSSIAPSGGFPSSFASPTTVTASAAPTFVPGDGSGAFICFPVASGFAVPGLNGTVVFPPSATGSAFPSSGPVTVTGTAVASSAFATGTAFTTSVFATGSAVASSAFVTASAAPSSSPV